MAYMGSPLFLWMSARMRVNGKVFFKRALKYLKP